MKNVLFILSFLLLISCKQTMTVTVSNSLPFNRTEELVSLSLKTIQKKLKLTSTKEIVVLKDGKQIPYQVTFDNQLIFPVSILANSNVKYQLKKGLPQMVDTLVYGQQYPERADDIAWENDLIAFRVYGPALQRSGERAFGYDIWTKYKTKKLVVKERYQMDLHPKDGVRRPYHQDHGNGLDYYKVGPTLGAGAAALLIGDSICYPKCYKTYKILDNGPLRFTLQLTFEPFILNGKKVTEQRLITLDRGVRYNKVLVNYKGMTENQASVIGIVLHDTKEEMQRLFPKEGIMTYADPTEWRNTKEKVFVGVVIPQKTKKMGAVYFSKQERLKKRGRAAYGHLLAKVESSKMKPLIYYFGGGWCRTEIKDLNVWTRYTQRFSQKIASPLRCEY